MKKIAYFLILLFAISACKYDESPYSFTREFENGTFITPDGKVKYISGTRDSLLFSTDKFAVIQQTITYVKKSDTTGINKTLNDSILIYGHVFSKNPNPEVCGYDSVTTINLIERLKTNSEFYYHGSSSPVSGSYPPTKFITENDLYAGAVFESSFGLQYEEDYYVRSFVVTGYFEGETPKYLDIAYNQQELIFSTSTPNDLWVGGGMDLSPADFIGSNNYWGATSFSYDGYMFVAQGHSETGLNDFISIYRYDPKENKWEDGVYDTYSLDHFAEEKPFTNPICFVIENVMISQGSYHDCLYIGLGASGNDLDEGNTQIYRLVLDDYTAGDRWENITSGLHKNPYFGSPVENAVAFTLNGIGYIGLGTIPGDDGANNTFFSYNPNWSVSNYENNPYGIFKRVSQFPNGNMPLKRTGAVVFKIDDYVYLSGGKDENGILYKDLWRCNQTATKDLEWVQRTSMPDGVVPREEAVGFALGNNGYVALGKDEDGNALRDLWRYDPETNRWDERALFGRVDMDDNLGDDIHDWLKVGEARYEAIGVGIRISDNDYRAYVGTGWGNNYPDSLYNDIWHYRP